MRALPAIACALLTGCAGTAPAPPQFAAAPIPPAWSEAAPAPLLNGTTSVWPTLFDDPILSSLMERAALANLDLWLADARLREVRSQADVVGAAGQSALNVNASYARERDSQNVPQPLQVGRSGTVEPPSGRAESVYRVGIDAAWDIDLFGARSHAADAVHAEAQASGHARDAVLRTVCAAVAYQYVVLRAAQQQGLLARADLAAQTDLLALLRARLTGGMGAASDAAQEVARAADQVARLAAQDADHALEAKRAMHRLGVLLGQPTRALLGELGAVRPIPRARAALPLVMPSELLRRRPDIARVEQQLAAASARREAAIAELFPRLSLNGAAGLASVSAGELLSSASLLTRIGPTLSWPILRRQQITATIAVRQAQQEILFVQYRQAVAAAFEDVENALAALAAASAKNVAMTSAVRERALALELASARYRGGMSDLRSVRDGEHALAQARSEHASSEAALASAAIALFNAAGGNWTPAAPSTPTEG
ncbi:efflux transporter outer membrane subunit [Massilia sp. PWRC2]|uniref:efflux transporter outer membrane subunit n=1 Tax=Massilia sp. PWRC2 TaxID=2804626 RepID=UPI003CF4BEFA